MVMDTQLRRIAVVVFVYMLGECIRRGVIAQNLDLRTFRNAVVGESCAVDRTRQSRSTSVLADRFRRKDIVIRTGAPCNAVY